jgi:hypothetical protein
LGLVFRHVAAPLSKDAVVRVVNHAENERMKKEKDDRKKKEAEKAGEA